MMGYSHAVSGVAGAALLMATGVVPAGSVEQVAVGAFLVAGGALLPDADHHNARAARSLWPLSGWVCRLIGKISGGHRQGTHSVVGVLVGGLLAWLVASVMFDVAPGRVTAQVGGFTIVLPAPQTVPVFHGFLGEAVLVAVAVALALGALNLASGLAGWLVAAGAGWLVLLWGVSPLTAAGAVTFGAVIHLAGDMLTTQGVPLLWPFFPKWFFKVPLLGNAGSGRENVLTLLLGAAALFGFVKALGA